MDWEKIHTVADIKAYLGPKWGSRDWWGRAKGGYVTGRTDMPTLQKIFRDELDDFLTFIKESLHPNRYYPERPEQAGTLLRLLLEAVLAIEEDVDISPLCSFLEDTRIDGVSFSELPVFRWFTKNGLDGDTSKGRPVWVSLMTSAGGVTNPKPNQQVFLSILRSTLPEASDTLDPSPLSVYLSNLHHLSTDVRKEIIEKGWQLDKAHPNDLIRAVSSIYTDSKAYIEDDFNWLFDTLYQVHQNEDSSTKTYWNRHILFGEPHNPLTTATPAQKTHITEMLLALALKHQNSQFFLEMIDPLVFARKVIPLKELLDTHLQSLEALYKTTDDRRISLFLMLNKAANGETDVFGEYQAAWAASPPTPKERELIQHLARATYEQDPDMFNTIKSFHTDCLGVPWQPGRVLMQSVYAVDIKDGGTNHTDNGDILRKIVSESKAVVTDVPSKPLPDEGIGDDADSLEALLSTFETKGKLRVYGRTLLIDLEDGDVLALKLEKAEDGDDIALAKEHAFKKRHAGTGDLKSGVPEAIGDHIFKATDLDAFLKEHLSRQDRDRLMDLKVKNGQPLVHAYKANPKYFQSLHDPETPFHVYKEGMKHAATDLGSALKGIKRADGTVVMPSFTVFHQLMAMYHTRDEGRRDSGRYQPFTHLFYDVGDSPGRLVAWDESVQWVNIVASGLKDFGDHINFKDFSHKDTQWAKPYFHEVQENHLTKDDFPNAVVTNFIGEYILTFRLIAMLRGRNMQKEAHQLTQAEAIEDIWTPLAETHLESVATLISTLSESNYDDIRERLSSAINVQRLARQMQFWGTDEYVGHINKEQIPSDIYGENVPVRIGKLDQTEYSSKKGYSQNGKDSDLGPANGADPVAEAIKLRNVAVTELLEAQKSRVVEATSQATTTFYHDSSGKGQGCASAAPGH